MISFKTQFDKLTRAYMTTGVNPYDGCFCFVGNLLNNKGDWEFIRGGSIYPESPIGTINQFHPLYNRSCQFIKSESNGFYSPQDIVDLEATFLSHYLKEGGYSSAYCRYFQGTPTEQDEHALWIAFVKGIEKLKEIHESKGEVIESCPTLEMRNEPVLIK